MTASLTYVIKFVKDMDASLQFHLEQFGLKLRFKSPEWSEFDTGTTTLALHLASPQNPPGTCQLGFRVPDIGRFHADATSRGVVFTSPPVELHGQRIARLRDIDGAEISVSGN